MEQAVINSTLVFGEAEDVGVCNNIDLRNFILLDICYPSHYVSGVEDVG